MLVAASILAVLALIIFAFAMYLIFRERRKHEARRVAQANWDKILDRISSDESARAAVANRNFEWRD